MKTQCDICGEQHDSSTHGEATTVLQPSLHSESEWTDIILSEAESYGADVSDLVKEWAETPEDHEDFPEICNEILLEAQGRLESLPGIFVYNGDDTFLVYDNRSNS